MVGQIDSLASTKAKDSLFNAEHKHTTTKNANIAGTAFPVTPFQIVVIGHDVLSLFAIRRAIPGNSRCRCRARCHKRHNRNK